MHLFSQIFPLIEKVLVHGGYWIIFVVSVLEAIPLLGSFVPGHALIILGGFLAKIGVLNAFTVIWVTALAAIVGDIIGYLLGKKYGFDFLVKFGKYFFLTEEHLQKASDIMDKHTGKALIIGRFNPVTRALTPFLAGASDLNLKKFWFYNLIGGISWAVSSVAVGYIFGASYEVFSKYIGKFIFIATVLSILMVWGYQFINSRRHIFVKYHLYTLIVNICALYVFFKTIQDALSTESFLAQLDVWVNLKMVTLATPTLDFIMLMITNILSPEVLLGLSLLLFLYLAHKKRWYHMFLVGFGLGGIAVLNSLIKLLVERARPLNAYVQLSDYSFPSGHAAVSVVFFVLVIYMCSSAIKNRYWKEAFGTLNIFIFLSIGFSRIYLKVHWLSDVVAGFSLGIFWLTFIMLLFKFLHSIVVQRLVEKEKQIVEEALL